MDSQAAVHSIDALKEFRTVLALYGDDTLAALGAVESEVRRTLLWLQQDRPAYWHDQIKRRQEAVASAKSEVFRRKLQKTADHSPSIVEQMENLRRAEARLRDAEQRLAATRKWQTLFQQAVLEYHGSVRRLKDMAAGDVVRGTALLGRIIDALENYLREAPPSGDGPAAVGSSGSAGFDAFAAIAGQALDDDEKAEAEAPVEPEGPAE